MMNCPKCGYGIDDASPVFGPPTKPMAGDLSICFNCGVLLVFTAPDPTQFRELLPTEEKALTNDEREQIDRIQKRVYETEDRYFEGVVAALAWVLGERREPPIA